MVRTGFCQNCQQNVLLTREDIDIWLVILLVIFTAGIGFIIYLIIHYSKEEDRCVHCKTRVSIFEAQYTSPNYENTYQAPLKYNQDQKAGQVNLNYCPYCGEQLEKENIRFCPHCGSKISSI